MNPELDVSQYAHTAWKFREGFSKGEIYDIAQTPDGYLWLGSGFGLLRFDGVRNVPWQPSPDQRLPSGRIVRLLAARDGTLWIGAISGLASWKNGTLTRYPELAGLAIFALLEDHEGAIWVGAFGIPQGKVCEIRNGSVRCYQEIGGLGHGVAGLHEDRRGNLWVGLLSGVWRWKPGPPEFYAVPDQANGIRGMADGEDGSLLIATKGAVRRLADRKVEVAYPFPAAMAAFQTGRILRDRDGGLWSGTSGGGIVHIHQRRTDVFSQSDGLSGDSVYALFEDREGSIWVSTVNGLDRFREFSVVTYSTRQGLSNVPTSGILGARDGSIWFGTSDGLNRLRNGQAVVYREHGARTRVGEREIAGSGLPDHLVASLFEDSRGRIWVSSQSAVGYLENGRFVSTPAPGGIVHALTEDAERNIWIANQELGFFRLSPRNEVQRIPWAALGRKDHVSVMTPDPLHGGLWLGFYQSGIAWFRDGQIRASYSAADGLAGFVSQLRFDREGALWAASEGGLSRLKEGRIATLSSKNGLPCDSVHWMMEDNAQSVWLSMPCGLVRVARSELDAWAAGGQAIGKIRTSVFDSSDGVRSLSSAGGYTPHVAKSPDGKLWFLVADGISVVDPRHLPFNKLPPPVRVEQITADRKTYDLTAGADGRLRLPPLVRDLEIDYTALSFAAPEKMRFRYMLEGHDRDWQDAGNRRQAFYNDLPPRHYRFRVAASNNSGVWNESGASFDFSVPPAYYQSNWFRVSCAAVFLALLGAIYRLRALYLARQFNLRMEERVSERTRISRDLHDTLLQGFQGVLLKFHVVTFLLPDRPSEARQKLESAIEEARQAIAEGRDAVQGLRSSTVITEDLARAITMLGEGLAADQSAGRRPDFRVHVEGACRNLAPLVRDEIYRITGEAMRNAFQHADAMRIEVEIRYDRRQLCLRVRDDGKGIDPKVLGEGGRAGHLGLPGMQERAELVGGKLAVWSELDSGTEIELAIPASVAYAKAPAGRPPLVSAKRT